MWNKLKIDWHLNWDGIKAFVYSLIRKKTTTTRSTVKSRFYDKSRIHIEKTADQIQILQNKVSQFYVMPQFYVASGVDQQYRKIEIWL